MANASAPQGVTQRVYKSGSIIYFEGDKSEYVYVLKSGGVTLTSIKIESGEETKDAVRMGEFFGVKSAVGRYPREETAQTIGDTVVLLLPLADFEKLAVSNIKIVKKMLKVFSNQLRRTGKTVREVLGESETLNPDQELFRIGEFYFKKSMVKESEYTFKRIMEHYPDSSFASAAMERIKAIQSGQIGSAMPSPLDSPEIPEDTSFDEISEVEAGFDSDFDADLDELEVENDGFLSDDNSVPDFSMDGGDNINSDLGQEMTDFLDDDSLDDGLDFDFNDGGDEGSQLAEADKLFDSADYSGALAIYDKIISQGEGSDDFYRAQIGKGNCYLNMSSFKEALGSFSTVIKEYGDCNYLGDAYYGAAQVFLQANQNDKSIPYLKKAQTVAGSDNIVNLAKQKLNEISNG